MNVLLVEGPEASSVQWKCSYCGPVESFGRIWFLETLLPSGRKHRAVGFFENVTLRSAEAVRRFLMRRQLTLSLTYFLAIFYLANREIRARM